MIRKLINKIQISKTISKCKCFGLGSFMDSSTIVSCPEQLSIGPYVHIQPGCALFADGGIFIGEGTIFAHEVQVFSRNHLYDADDLKALPYDSRYVCKAVSIGKYVWIRARSTILPGVSVGDGAVIAACAVVTKDVPKGAVVAGNPARVVRSRNPEVYEKLENNACGYIKTIKNR